MSNNEEAIVVSSTGAPAMLADFGCKVRGG